MAEIAQFADQHPIAAVSAVAICLLLIVIGVLAGVSEKRDRERGEL